MATIDFAAIGLTKTNLLSSGMAFIIFIVFIVVAMIAIWLMMFLAKYNTKVFVEERRGNSIVEYLTRGGIIINPKSGVKELVVWRSKWNWSLPLRSEVPDNKYFRLTITGKKFLRIIKDSVDTFKVIPPNDKTLMQKLFHYNNKQSTTVIVPIPTIDYNELSPPVDLDWYNWASQTIKGMSPRFRNDVGFLRENAGIVGLGLVSFVFIVMIIVGFQKWEDGSSNLAAAARSNAAAMKSMENVRLATAGIQTVPTPTPPSPSPSEQVLQSLT